MKTYLRNGLVVEVLEASLSALGLPDPRTLLSVTFSCGGMLKTKFLSPLSAKIDVMKDQITAAVNTVNLDMLRRVWEEFSYRPDVVRAAGGGHTEHLQNIK